MFAQIRSVIIETASMEMAGQSETSASPKSRLIKGRRPQCFKPRGDPPGARDTWERIRASDIDHESKIAVALDPRPSIPRFCCDPASFRMQAVAHRKCSVGPKTDPSRAGKVGVQGFRQNRGEVYACPAQPGPKPRLARVPKAPRTGHLGLRFFLCPNGPVPNASRLLRGSARQRRNAPR